MERREDLYRILGVSEKATENEIKQAYRKLAKKYHPDSHPGDKECERRFQEISEAYSILSDSEKRKQYDSQKQEESRGQAGNANSGKKQETGNSQYSSVDFENVYKSFEQFFGFNPDSKDITNEKKLNPKSGNPLDTTDMFERFMGIKR